LENSSPLINTSQSKRCEIDKKNIPSKQSHSMDKKN
jgi:hypothetical protein